MNALSRPRLVPAIAAAASRYQPPPPPIGVTPVRYGNGAIELQIYPAATAIDRVAAAAALLHGTGFIISPAQEKA